MYHINGAFPQINNALLISMKKINSFLILIFAVMILSGAAFSQTATRINFAKGATTATATGRLNGYKDKRVFLLRVRKGQTLQIEQSKSNDSLYAVTVSVTGPTGAPADDWDASCNSRKNIEPTSAGDYRITVFECRKADAWRGRFRLKITVR